MTKYFLILVGVLISLPSFAEVRLSLVTVSPGPSVFEAFGHSAVLKVDTEQPTQNAIYEYGFVDPRSFLSVFLNARPTTGDEQEALVQRFLTEFQRFFQQQVLARIRKLPVTIHAQTGMPDYIQRTYLNNPAVRRQVWISPLHLNATQSRAMLGLLERDVASGEYAYNYYNDNCVTRIRDRLFDDSVLGSARRRRLESSNQELTREDMIRRSLNQAAADSIDHTITLLPSNLTRDPRVATMLGQVRATLAQMRQSVEIDYRQGRRNTAGVLIPVDVQFTDTMRRLDILGQSFLQGSPALTHAFHTYFFGPELSVRPLSVYQSLFTPARLRDRLLTLRVIRSAGETTARSVATASAATTVPAEAPSLVPVLPVTLSPVLLPAASSFPREENNQQPAGRGAPTADASVNAAGDAAVDAAVDATAAPVTDVAPDAQSDAGTGVLQQHDAAIPDA